MIKKTLTYDGFDGRVTADFYFHLSKADLARIESTDGGLIKKIDAVQKAENMLEAIGIFETLIGAAVGERQGERFIKNDEVSQGFLSSPAFDVLLDELLTSEGAAAQFVVGLMPSGLIDTGDVTKALLDAGFSAEAVESGTIVVQAPLSDSIPDSLSGLRNPRDDKGHLLPWAFRDPTVKESVEMAQGQLQQVFLRKSSGWNPPAVQV